MFKDYFNQIPIFADLSPEKYDLLESIFCLETCLADQTIFIQGDIADYLYIILGGEVAIQYKPDDGDVIEVSRISPGGVFGWSAAFGSEAYTSGATSLSDCQMLKVLGADLKELCQNHPETGILVLERLASVVVKRVKNTQMQGQVFALLEYAMENGVRPVGG